MKKFFLACLVLFSSYSFSFEVKLSKIKGEVLVDGKAASEAMKLKAGQNIEAKGEKSLFIILYPNGSKHMVRNGKLLIQKMEKDSSFFHLFYGLFVSFVNGKKDGKFKVSSREAVFGVRGTKFWLKREKEKSYLCVCEGNVEVANYLGLATVSKGQDIHVELDKKFQTTQASEQMLSMAIDDLKYMGVDVE